jgi:hypothetical protein
MYNPRTLRSKLNVFLNCRYSSMILRSEYEQSVRSHASRNDKESINRRSSYLRHQATTERIEPFATKRNTTSSIGIRNNKNSKSQNDSIHKENYC